MKLLALLLVLGLLAYLRRPRVEPRAGEHPERTCQRCKGPNLRAWHAPSPLWNAVMRGSEDIEWGIVCPQCFAELAKVRGVIDGSALWCLRPDQGVIVELPTHDPDGRRWDPERCLWVGDARVEPRADFREWQGYGDDWASEPAIFV